MLKLIKYEFRKNFTPLLIFFGLLIILEIFFLYGYITEDDGTLILAISGLVLSSAIAYFVILAIGIFSYSRELKNKTIYLIFMTPNSTIKIILSKLIHVALTAIITGAIFATLGIYDLKLYIDFLGDTTISVTDIIDILLASFNTNISQVIFSVIGFIIVVLVVLLTYVVMGYLSITLSQTLLSNSNAKGFLSAVFFIILFVINTIIVNHLPILKEYPKTIMEYVYARLPQTIFELILMIIMIIGTAQLLDKKISL